jgi:hypothetical protein
MRPQDRGERNLESLTGDKPWIDKDFPEPKKGQPYHFTDQVFTLSVSSNITISKIEIGISRLNCC